MNSILKTLVLLGLVCFSLAIVEINLKELASND